MFFPWSKLIFCTVVLCSLFFFSFGFELHEITLIMIDNDKQNVGNAFFMVLIGLCLSKNLFSVNFENGSQNKKYVCPKVRKRHFFLA